MSSKETPKKVYQAPSSALFDPLSCRLCRIGDASHRVKIFNPNNQQLLTIAEKLCGRSIVAHSSLPNVICRPCEQRLKNILEFQKVILKSDGEFREATEVNLNVRVKRLVEVSPSISRPQESRLPVTERRTARTSLTFENIQQPPANPSYVEVAACFFNYFIVYQALKVSCGKYANNKA